MAGRRSSHHRDGLEDRVRGRPGDRGGRHGRDPRVHEDGDARRGRGRRHGQGDLLRRRASRCTRATRWSSSRSDRLASGSSSRRAGGRGRPLRSPTRRRDALDHEILDGLAETVSELDARCLVVTGTDGMFSAGYDIGDLEGRTFAEDAERLVAHPFTAALEALEAYPYAVVAAAPATRSAAGSSWRSAATSGSPPAASARHAARQARPHLLPHGLRRFVEALGPPTPRAVPPRPQRRLRPRRADGARQPGRRARRARGARAGAGRRDRGQRAALARGQQAGPRARCGDAGGSTRSVERELVALRESCFRSEDMREGVRAFGEKRPPGGRAGSPGEPPAVDPLADRAARSPPTCRPAAPRCRRAPWRCRRSAPARRRRLDDALDPSIRCAPSQKSPGRRGATATRRRSAAPNRSATR